MPIYYHGGAPGLRPGDRLLSTLVTGADPRGEGVPQIPTAIAKFRRDRVFFTTAGREAVQYAADWPDRTGTVYQVEPIGDVEPDPSMSQSTWKELGELLEAVRPGEFRGLISLAQAMPQAAVCAPGARVVAVIGQPWHAPLGAWWRITAAEHLV